MELKEAVGQVVRTIRLHRNLPQGALGPSQAFISDLERGVKSASLEKLVLIADALDVSVMTILVSAYENMGVPANELFTRVLQDRRMLNQVDTTPNNHY